MLPGIGGFIGSAIGSLFCHAAGTMIRMEDGTRKAIETLQMGDRVLLGGAVMGRGEVIVKDLYRYKGTIVNGRHAVLEDGKWIRVENSDLAVAFTTETTMKVYPIVTEHHLLVCESYICADLAEVDGDVGAVGRLKKLNSAREWTAKLSEYAKDLKLEARAAA